MAVTTKTTSTVNIILQDSMNGDVVFKVDNPDDDQMNMGNIRTAFDPVINVSIPGDATLTNLLCTKQGYQIIAVVGAEKVTTVVTKETIG